MMELPYKKLCRILKYRILSGGCLPGQKLLSVRTMAKKIECNPATVQHALSCLEQQGLVFSKTTVGYFITADVSKIDELRMNEIKLLTNNLYDSLSALGYSDAEICRLIQEI